MHSVTTMPTPPLMLPCFLHALHICIAVTSRQVHPILFLEDLVTPPPLKGNAFTCTPLLTSMHNVS